MVSHTESHEEYKYGRGKGLRVVFTRFRGIPNSPALLTRAGRRVPRATFNVRGTTRGSAQGEASRTGDAAACQPLTEAVGDESECNRPIRRALDMALGYDNGRLQLEISDGELVRLPGSGCGSNSIETISGWPLFGWQGFPDLDPEALPVRRIFGGPSAFKIRLSGGDTLEIDSPNPAFQGRVNEFGRHKAVVRFIRR